MIQRKFKIGSSSFGDLVAREEGEFKYYFVDKTLFIKQFLESQSTILVLPRPRRFGKSTNLDMLKCFFSLDEAIVNKELFKDLKIEKAILANGKNCIDYRGRYPVIKLSLKDLKQNSLSDLLGMLKTIISELYETFSYLLQSEKLLPEKNNKHNNLWQEQPLMMIMHKLYSY